MSFAKYTLNADHSEITFDGQVYSTKDCFFDFRDEFISVTLPDKQQVNFIPQQDQEIIFLKLQNKKLQQ